MRKWFSILAWALAVMVVLAANARAQGVEGLTPTQIREIAGEQGTQLPSGAREESVSRPGQIPMSGPVDPMLYRVGPGDVLQIQLWGKVTRNWTLTVNPEGYILVPGTGSVMVSGKSLTQVRTEVIKLLQTKYRGVGMDVRLSRPRLFNVYLTGQVKAAGPIQATGSYRIADVLPESVFQDNASRRRIEVIHRDSTRDYADLVAFTHIGQESANPMLRDGDVINVPVATEWIHAQGALGRAGRYELGLNDSLITLFRLGGDPIPAAVVDRALVIRWRDAFEPDSMWVRLDDVYARRVNPVLRDGDRLYVYYLPQYHLQHEVYIQGEVSRPGVYPIVEGKQRLTDLIRSADGFLPTADLTSIRVHRRNLDAQEKDPELDRLLRLPREQLTDSEYDKLTTKLAAFREDYRVDWTQLNANSPHQDLLLRDGDAVRVERLVSSIRIDGEVKRPGILSFRPGLKISDYVRQAGGLTNRAWSGNIRVTRAVTGQTLPARNVQALDPGDFVWVPERPDKSFWDYATPILVALAQVATVVIAVDSLNE